MTKFLNLNLHQISFKSTFLPSTILFNFCVENGILPDSLKISKVFPIYKSDPKENMSKYRPILLLPILSKVQYLKNESIVKFFSFIEKHNILSSTQYSFRANIFPELAVLQ